MLANRIALVTGAGSGIGRAVCQKFAKQQAVVVAADARLNAAEETAKLLEQSTEAASTPLNGHRAVQLDVRDSAGVSELFKRLSDVKAIPSIVVNAAGITRDKFMKDMTEEEFDDVIDVNLKGTWLICKAASQLMLENKLEKGSIVNISSVSAKGNMGQTNYAASKAGVEGMTKSIAKELAKFNIRCNAVVPGYIDTPMVQTVPEKLQQILLMLTPMGRMGLPEEVADAILFYASDQSSFVTGTALQVSGGFQMS